MNSLCLMMLSEKKTIQIDKCNFFIVMPKLIFMSCDTLSLHKLDLIVLFLNVRNYLFSMKTEYP